MTDPNASHPGPYVRSEVIPTGMTVTKAAQTIGIGRPALSNFLNGKAALSRKMAAKLQRAFGADAGDLIARQAAYDAALQSNNQVVAATTRTFVPPFLHATANDINGWADTHEARELLPVLLRTLVNSTCGGLQLVDFPGGDDSQRPGWDGRVGTNEGNPWIPEDASAWEFGTDKRVTQKANRDFAKRTANTDQAERKRTAFVFVTPRRWPGKAAWLEERQGDAQWKAVYAWDASDLEQWLEQSIPAQVWFEDRRRRNTRGVKTLDRCWAEWCADCQPRLTEALFAEAATSFKARVLNHLRGDSDTLLRVVADSRQEGLAFLAAVLSQTDPELREFRDRVVVFTKEGPLSELAVGSPGFIAVATSEAVEREWAQSGFPIKGFVVEPRAALRQDSVVALDPLSRNAFTTALSSMGLDRESIHRLERESGRSLTVLRRRLAQSEAIRSPAWSASGDLARSLVPLALAGAWVADKAADQYLIAELAGHEGYGQLERRFTGLLNLEDSPVWSVGGYHGVVSKVDSLFGVHRWITEEDIDRFVTVAEIVLSERDPALDLDKGQRWAAPLYEKAREISKPLRQGVAESLVLLSIHGSRLFGGRFGREPKHAVANLVQGLLTPLTADGLLSQSSNLPLYAEAAPEVFLRVFEQDLATADPVVQSLMSPANNIPFARGDRVDLVWALELLAWRPEWLARVVALLGALAELEPDDNLANKPSASLQAIFRSWMPQTAAPVEQRIAVFDNILVKRHPSIAWKIASSQFDPSQRHGDYSEKPRWRDYALGFGEPDSRDHHAFVVHCIETCVGWRPHDRGTLADLIGKAERIRPDFVEQLWKAVVEWAQDASDQDRAWLRERVRVSTGRTIRRNSRAKPTEQSNQGVSMARNALDLLEPANPIWRHAWLFQNAWVDESWDELDEGIDFDERERRTRRRRRKAAAEVFAECGYGGLLRLAFSGNAAFAAGWAATEAMGQESALDLLKAALRDADVLVSVPHQHFVSGVLRNVGGTAAITLAQRLWPQFGREVGVKLLCLCDFGRLAWSETEAFGEAVAAEYWANVAPSFWGEHTRDDLNFAVSRLLEASRPRAAFDMAHLHWGRVESTHIRRILIDLPISVEPSLDRSHLDAYNIQQALKVLNERDAFSQTERAQLEFLYLEASWREEDRLPNLEKEIEDHPELFCKAIALAFRRKDERDSPERTPDQVRIAQMAFRLLNKLAGVPGQEPDGTIDAAKLKAWVVKAQELCEKSDHKQIGDEQIGQLLANAPTGRDDVWPCVPVRDALEVVLNDDMQRGFVVGRRNSRGAHIRDEGGAQERELAAQYEKWAKACDYAHPRVAATLRRIASAYEDEARWHDRDAAVERRFGY